MAIEIKLEQDDIEKIATRVAEKLQDMREENVVRTYTVKDVAKITNSTTATITRHINKKLLKAKKTGKSYTITENNLKKYLENE